MKKIFYVFIFTLAVNVTIHAQSKEESRVAEAVQTLKKAMLDGDKTQLENIVADELSYGHSSGKIEDKATFVDALASGKSDFKSIDLTDQTIKVAGNTAIVRHNLSGEVTDNGKTNSVKLGVLLVWVKQHKQWKLLARQAYKI